MDRRIVGNPTDFAIEWKIDQAFNQLGLRALGFFRIHLNGKDFGVKQTNATLMACSYDSVVRRISNRGLHIATFSNEPTYEIMETYVALQYSVKGATKPLIDVKLADFGNSKIGPELVWAPDGDEAFDDGSHIFHFDQGDKVRLIAFKNIGTIAEIRNTISDKVFSSSSFYQLLEKWAKEFEAEREKMLQLH